MGSDRLTHGPLNPAGTNPFDTQALVQDVDNNILEWSGTAQQRTAARQTLAIIENAAALSAITTAQNLISKAFKAGVFNVLNRRVRVHGRLVYSTTSANVATLTIALTLAGVTLCSITTAATNTAASTNLPVTFDFEFMVTATGAGGAVISYGEVKANIGTTAAAAIADYLDTNLFSQNTITIGTNPTAGATITVNSTLVTFIVNGGTPVGNQVALGTTATLTATALYTFLAASTDANISKATYTNPSNGVVLAVSNTAGAVPYATTSVPADITFTVPTLNLQAADTLTVTLAASAAVPSAQLLDAQIELVG